MYSNLILSRKDSPHRKNLINTDHIYYYTLVDKCKIFNDNNMYQLLVQNTH